MEGKFACLAKKNGRQRGALCRPNRFLGLSPPRFRNIGRLGTLRSLDDFEFNCISLLKSAISIPGDCGIVNEYVWAIIAPDEAISFRIVKPFDGSLHCDCLLTGIHKLSSHGDKSDILSAVKNTNCAESTRIKVRVKGTFSIYSKDKYSEMCTKSIQKL